MTEALQALSELCLETIQKGQQVNGEFKTFLFFPGKAENGWIYSGPSVFLTSSAGIALLEYNDERAKNISGKAAAYVRSQMEAGGLWRFYPHHGLFKFNTPMDVDDTSLASYLLQQCGIAFPDNKKVLLKQRDRWGNFYIWLLPRIRYLFQPGLFLRLLFDLRFSFPIFFPLKGRTSAALIGYNDYEHAVSANALLYLGKTPETQKTINHIIEDLLFGNTHNLFFYPGPIFTWYHASRLYHAGIQDFANLKTKVSNYFKEHSEEANKNILNKAISVITLINFGENTDQIAQLISGISQTPADELLQPYPYFCTKDRNMVGGSIEFTCVIVLESIRKYLSQLSANGN